jgi:hypothetical protein
MACGGCGKKAAERGVIAPISRGLQGVNTRSPLAPAGMVMVVYNGTIGNHFVFSPTQRVNGQRVRYGYFSRGDIFPVWPDDVKARPDLFVPMLIGEAVDPEPMAEDAPDAVWADDVLPAEATPKPEPEPEPEPAVVVSPPKRSRKKAS